VGPVEGAHEGGHGARRRPDGEDGADDRQHEAAALVLVQPPEAAAQELGRLGRDDLPDFVQEGLDAARARDEREHADGEQEHGGHGEGVPTVGLALTSPLYSWNAAGVAELVDAAGLGPAGRKPLEVRVLSPASQMTEVSHEEGRRRVRLIFGALVLVLLLASL